MYKNTPKHPGLHRPDIKNPIRSAATNQLQIILTNQTQSTVAAEQRNHRLEAMMLLDPHVKYAKSIGIEDTKIRYALLQQMDKKIIATSPIVKNYSILF